MRLKRNEIIRDIKELGEQRIKLQTLRFNCCFTKFSISQNTRDIKQQQHILHGHLHPKNIERIPVMMTLVSSHACWKCIPNLQRHSSTSLHIVLYVCTCLCVLSISSSEEGAPLRSKRTGA